MYETIKPNGLLVFGENEYGQGIDKDRLYDVLSKHGFSPIDLNPQETAKFVEEYKIQGIKHDLAKRRINIWKKLAKIR